MRKEVILAVIIGIILGGVILYGIKLANQSISTDTLENNLDNINSPATPPHPSPTSTQIEISFPQNNAVILDTSLTLKGIAKPNSPVAIITENDDLITTTDATGAFSSPITLIGGENILTVTSINEQQATISASVTVIHTTASLP